MGLLQNLCNSPKTPPPCEEKRLRSTLPRAESDLIGEGKINDESSVFLHIFPQTSWWVVDGRYGDQQVAIPLFFQKAGCREGIFFLGNVVGVPARVLFPEIQAFFRSEEGRQELAEWEARQQAAQKNKICPRQEHHYRSSCLGWSGD